MKRWGLAILQILLVAILILSGLIVTKRLIATKPKIKKTRPAEVAPFVSVKNVKPETVTVMVNTEGTVSPSKEIEIAPQVSGKAIYVSKNLVRGGRFEKDELLIKIEDSDYIAALKKAEAELKTQQARLHQLKEESAEAKAEWLEINPDASPPALLLKLPDIEATEAAIAAARASLERAQLDLNRTEIRAPFSGVVITESIDVGQYLRAGQSVARIFSDEMVEIKVNLTEKDVGFINVPGFNTPKQRGSSAEVETSIGGRIYKWMGYVGRAEIVDEKTRTIPVIVVVEKPYETLPPLSVGAFVKVKIKGRSVENAVVLEKSAIQWTEQGNPYVWIVGPENRLSPQDVDIIREANGRYIVTGLKDNLRVVTTPPPLATERMKVRIKG